MHHYPARAGFACRSVWARVRLRLIVNAHGQRETGPAYGAGTRCFSSSNQLSVM